MTKYLVVDRQSEAIKSTEAFRDAVLGTFGVDDFYSPEVWAEALVETASLLRKFVMVKVGLYQGPLFSNIHWSFDGETPLRPEVVESLDDVVPGVPRFFDPNQEGLIRPQQHLRVV